MTRVLVTGATTPLGIALVKGLLADARVDRVIAVARSGEPSPIGSADPRYCYVSTDLTRTRNLRNLLHGEAHDATCVVHTACHRSVRNIGPRAHRLNVETTRLLLSLAEDHPNISRFVYRSSGAVYRIDSHRPSIINEFEPLQLSPQTPQWIRDRVEADLTVCMRSGLASLDIAVLRFAECVTAHMGSQLHDYLNAPVCFTPWGFDPILNVIALDDMVEALVRAVHSDAVGIFNIPGADTLALSETIRLSGRRALPALGPLLSPLYAARALLRGTEFHYALNQRRFHWSGVLCGRRAKDVLGYEPCHSVSWPRLPADQHPALRA